MGMSSASATPIVADVARPCFLFTHIGAVADLVGAGILCRTGGGTYAGKPILVRPIYWTATIGIGFPVAMACRAISAHLGLVGYWRTATLAAVLFATLYSPVIYGSTILLGRFGASNIVPIWLIWLVVALSSISLSAIRHMGLPGEQPRLAAEATGDGPAVPDPPSEPRLLARMDPELRGPVASLSVRDHYVVVTTDRAQVNLLMRFADAMAELDGVDGMQVHRSHWVAIDEVAGSVRENGKVFVTLKERAPGAGEPELSGTGGDARPR